MHLSRFAKFGVQHRASWNIRKESKRTWSTRMYSSSWTDSTCLALVSECWSVSTLRFTACHQGETMSALSASIQISERSHRMLSQMHATFAKTTMVSLELPKSRCSVPATLNLCTYHHTSITCCLNCSRTRSVRSWSALASTMKTNILPSNW